MDSNNLEKGLNNVAKDNRKTFEQISKDTGKSVEDIKKEVKKLAEEYQKQGMNIPLSYKKAYRELGILAKKNADEVSEQAEKISDSYEKSSKKTSESFKKISSGLSGIGSVAGAGVSAGISGIATGIKAVVGASAAAVGGLAALGAATAEYRDEQAKLNSAFQEAGYSTEVAQEAYQQFYSILGEEDTAVEASQLLAKLSLNQQDMSKWTEIATGVWATFGDALPVEGLIESANETAKVGKVTGNLADALNWAGISEDEFNKKLESLGSEAERNQLIMQTLSGEYQNAANIFKQNNATIMEARKAQSQLMESLGGLGEAVNNISNKMLVGFGPAITSIIDAFTNLINGVEGADEQLATAISNLINKGIEQLPQFINFGADILIALASGIVENIPALAEAGLQIIIGLQEKIIENLPNFISTASEILQGLANSITKNLPIILKNGNEITMQLVNGIIENLPLIIDTGIEIILMLVDSLVDSLPKLIPAAVEAIITIAESLINNIDKIIDAAIELILALSDGLIKALPKLAEKIPEIISKLVFELTKPETQLKLLDAGTQLILALIEGIFKMNVNLAQSAWDSVKTFAKELLNTDDMVNAGKDLIRGLIDGIKSMTGEVYATMKNFTAGVVKDVKSFFGIHSPSRVFRDEVGVWLPLGMADGILSKAKEVIEALVSPVEEAQEEIKIQGNVFTKNLSDIISNATDEAKKEAKDYAEVGEILIESISGSVKKNVDDVLTPLKEEIEKNLSENIEVVEKNAEELINAYTEKIQAEADTEKEKIDIAIQNLSKEAPKTIKNQLQKDKKAIDENAKALIKTYSDGVKKSAEEEKNNLKNTADDLLNVLTTNFEQGVQQVNEIINVKIGGLAETYQAKFDNLLKAQEDLANKLADSNLFSFEEDNLVVENLEQTITTLEKYDQAITQLKEKGISDAILNELAGYDTEEVLKITEHLLQMTDVEFQKLNEKWQEKQELATKVASNFYKEQIQVLEKDFNSELTKTLNELPTQVEDIGIMTIEGFQNGLESRMDSILDDVRSFAESVIAQMQKALDVHSPSRKMQWLGNMTMDGYEKGVKESAKPTLKSIANIPIFDTFKEQVARAKAVVNMSVNSMIPKSSQISNVSNSTKNITNDLGDFNIYISGLKNDSASDIQTFLQQAEFYRKTRANAIGGA